MPYDIKRLIVDKCLEGLSGPYFIIREFRKFFEEQNVSSPDLDATREASPEMYDDNETVFQFSARSADSKAGKGAGETIGSEGYGSYTELNGINNWRRKLSNEWEQEFVLDNKRWGSVDIYMHGVRFKKNNPAFYAQFSIDSESNISKNLKLAKEASEKRKTELRPKDVDVDPDFYNGTQERELEKAVHAKFSQNNDLMTMLKATKRAKIQKYIHRSPAEVMDILMRIRYENTKLGGSI